MALASSTWVSSNILDLLVGDGDFVVASTAESALEGLSNVFA